MPTGVYERKPKVTKKTVKPKRKVHQGQPERMRVLSGKVETKTLLRSTLLRMYLDRDNGSLLTEAVGLLWEKYRAKVVD